MPKFSLRTPNARRSIPADNKRRIASLPSPGLAIDYRKSPTKGGVWFVRKLQPGTKNYTFHSIGAADDTHPANGATVFSYEEAVREAEKWNAQETGVVLVNKSYNVRNLMDDYLAHQEMKKRRPQDKKRKRIENHILPTLGDIPLRKLAHHQVESWLHNLAKSLPRKRDGQKRKIANVDDEEYRRKRQATANTVWTLLKAALNFGYKQDKVGNRAAWDRVQGFRAVNEPRIVEIAFDQVEAVIAACEPEFQPLAKAALYTGARIGELHRMRVRDFNPRFSKVFLPKTKNGNSRDVFLHDEALELFATLTKGRAPDDVIFLKDGEPWEDGSQQWPMYNACHAAGVTRKFTFHQFRHQCACICLANGMRMEEVSRMLGHKDIQTTQKHYARFSQDHMQDKVERYAPRLRPVAPQNDPNNAAKVIAFRRVAGAS